MNFMKKIPKWVFAGAFLLLASTITFAILNSKRNDDESKPDATIKIADGLPSLQSIDPNKSPMLYDFVNGSLGYKMDFDPINAKGDDGKDHALGIFYAILRNRNDGSKIYASHYSYGEKLVFPTLGSNPKSIPLIKSEEDAVNQWFDNVSKSRKYVEGTWEMAIVTQYNDFTDDGINASFNYVDTIGRWAGLDLSAVNIAIDGPSPMSGLVNGGYGWPTEWLRKNPYRDTIREFAGYNIDDPFWDKWNIQSYRIYTKNGNKDDKLKVYLDQLDRFKLQIPDGSYAYLNERQLNQYLSEEGYE